VAVTILESRYNSLQSRIRAIYGAPASVSATSGYGQGLRSTQATGRTGTNKDIDAASDIDYTTDRITIPAHGWSDRDYVEYDALGTTPIIGNIVDDAHYFVKVIDPATIELYYDEDLTSKVNLFVNAAGTHRFIRYPNQKVDAQDYFNLYLDVAAARIHQVGAAYTIPNNALVLAGDTVEDNYLTAIETLMTDVEADKFLIADPGQVDLINLVDGTGTSVNSTRTTNWNGTIAHEFTFRHSSTALARGFWNAGGQVRITPSLSDATGQKSLDWGNMLNAPNGVGELTFSRTGVSITGIGTSSGTSITPANITGTYQTILERFGNTTYAANRFRIYVKRNSDSEIQFKVEFADLDSPPGFGIDESVNGTLSSSAKVYNPNGSFTVGGITYNTVSYSPTGLRITSL
jgi:hypothetical protein